MKPKSESVGTVLESRWETVSRWYEVDLMRDLLGDWVVIRRWGGKGSNRHGQKTELVVDEIQGIKAVEVIGQMRVKRGYVPVRQKL